MQVRQSAIKIQSMRVNENVGELRRRVGQYSYLSKDSIGKGYSSVVYRGVNDSLGQPVAIKLIDMKNIKGEVHKTLLGNEMEILRLLSNLQNVIKLHDILPLKAHTCIVTELCDGGDLARTIKARKALPEKEATDILQQVIAGYRGIHRFGIVHRDLKPANIFFSEGKVKIADFGFAIRNADLKKSTNYNVGSPVYMPLEALNDNLYSAKSDVWAIGVIFFEMLTGRTPWKAKTEAELKKQIKSVPIRSLLPPSLSRTAADFLVRALQVNPALRMSPEEMGDFFEKAQEDPHSTTAGSSLRTNYLFRTRAMSQDREERVEQTDLLLPLPKNTVTAPKTFRKISRLAEGLPKAEGTNGFERESIGERVGEAKLGSLARTVAGLGGEWVPDHRKTSAQLLSQIHLCRFFYKLIERLEALGRGEEKLRKVMGAMIGGKLQEIRDLSHIPSGYATIFKRTKQYEKLYSVIEGYSEKYARVVAEGAGWGEAGGWGAKEIEGEVRAEIVRLYAEVEGGGVEGREEEVVLLDYLITLKQLLALNAGNDLDYFHRKSKIEAIVEGRPAKTITPDHLAAIVHKLRLFHVI